MLLGDFHFILSELTVCMISLFLSHAHTYLSQLLGTILQVLAMALHKLNTNPCNSELATKKVVIPTEKLAQEVGSLFEVYKFHIR